MIRRASFVVAALAALSASGCTSDAAPKPAPKVVATDATTRLDLGRDFCGSCVDGARTHLASVDGVGAIDYTAGARFFTVHYDSKKVTPAQIVQKLVASGEPATKLAE
jgi:copper chaperone CopZ